MDGKTMKPNEHQRKAYLFFGGGWVEVVKKMSVKCI